MIPKKIHYCWFGEEPCPKLTKKCIRSWRKYCPDYDIIEWNEKNFDINCNAYVKEAYEAKKWAFVTDYVRLWAVYNFGGIYFDTDVEVIRNIDKLMDENAFFACEDEIRINTGIGFGAMPKNYIVKTLLESYQDIHFKLEDGSFDMTTCPTRNTRLLKEIFKDKELDFTKVTNIDGMCIYPSEYFCPVDYDTNTIKITKNTYAIHHFYASWRSDEYNKERKKRYRQIKRKNIKHLIIHAPNLLLIKMLGEARYEKIKARIKKKLKNR